MWFRTHVSSRHGMKVSPSVTSFTTILIWVWSCDCISIDCTLIWYSFSQDRRWNNGHILRMGKTTYMAHQLCPSMNARYARLGSFWALLAAGLIRSAMPIGHHCYRESPSPCGFLSSQCVFLPAHYFVGKPVCWSHAHFICVPNLSIMRTVIGNEWFK